MESPFEAQQSVLLSRIITNVEKLNEAMTELTSALNEINTHNANVQALTEMWASYNRNVRFNLQGQSQLKEPI